MSYSVTTFLVSLDKLRTVCGSGDTKLAQEIISQHEESLMGTDQMGEYFDDFEEEIEEEYEAYKKGDFSHKHAIVSSQGDTNDEEFDDVTEEEHAEFLEALKSGNEEKALEFMQKAMGGLFDEDDDDEEEDGEEEELEEEDLQRELTTGGALADLILGRPKDYAFGFKYGYALEAICDKLGKHLPGDAWCSINFRARNMIAKLAPADFDKSLWIDGLLGRGAPVEMPTPSDFPGIGFLTWQEAEKLRPVAEQVYSACEDTPDTDWELEALEVFLKWLDKAISKKEDLVFFYY
ncbi:hypothetical protein [Blastopirellula marina]|uniref:DUF7691 domain-containing protein n=1 Tax=Blastopirellula marina TaxID=124 RepID=A0A2S8G9D6_9BACT|nr:hypothetical protein [Blastopirellula marina]PQO40881.1 hypothetical protein C5Y98_04700 [Blastopirellula marina]PTL45763.1 hypothetical protein C5Y97_04700 [Blastopirellula marina]